MRVNISLQTLPSDICCAHGAMAMFAWHLLHAGCPVMQGMCRQSGVRVR